MPHPPQSHPVRTLHNQLKSGEITRRQFTTRAAALGLSASAIAMIANNTVSAQSATPEATPVPLAGFRPDAGTEGQTRGAGGDLRILVPQAASALSVHNATGGKDISAGSVISEALLDYDANATLVAKLAAEVPSQQNGLLADDLSTVTFKLRHGVLWSDGEPFTASDVEFTWQWNVDPNNQSIDQPSWEIIAAAEVIDDLTITFTFVEPTLGWFQPFGSNLGVIYPKHFWDGKDALEANAAFAQNPVGTGPYIVETFAPNDQIVYAANPQYREASKPFFQRVIVKGGGDPSSAVTAVTTTGDWDIAFTLQIDPDALRAVLGDKGAVYGPPGTGVEKIQFNFSDPNTEVDGQRSEKNTPHPFLIDPAIRHAIATAIDRQTIADRLYGGAPTDPASSNMLVGIEAYTSPNTSWTFDLEQAASILDEAGWLLNGSVREKDGMPLKLRYATTINQQRQKVQAVVKDNLTDIGFDVELVQVDGSIFFDGDVTNDQNFTHFYYDMQEYTDGATSAFPLNYMKYWYAGPDGENIAQASNKWTGTNKTRYSNPEYDALWEQIASVTNPDDAVAIFVELNDHVINNVVEIPLVQVVADRYVVQNTIRQENIAVTPFGDVFWNLANWNRV
jgi:peptide/nickel transport system substrate-binding protein